MSSITPQVFLPNRVDELTTLNSKKNEKDPFITAFRGCNSVCCL